MLTEFLVKTSSMPSIFHIFRSMKAGVAFIGIYHPIQKFLSHWIFQKVWKNPKKILKSNSLGFRDRKLKKILTTKIPENTWFRNGILTREKSHLKATSVMKGPNLPKIFRRTQKLRHHRRRWWKAEWGPLCLHPRLNYRKIYQCDWRQGSKSSLYPLNILGESIMNVYSDNKSIIVRYLARTWSRKEREIDFPLLV